MRKIKTLFIVTTGVFLLVMLFSVYSPYHSYMKPPLRSYYMLTNREMVDPDSQLDPDQLCQIPQPNPWDETILEFVFETGPVKCREVQPKLTYIGLDGVLRVNVSAVKEASYGWGLFPSVSCTYQNLIRPLGKDDETEYGTERMLNEKTGAAMTAEYVSVRCKNWIGWTVYAILHAFPLPLRLRDAEGKIVPNSTVTERKSRSTFPESPTGNILPGSPDVTILPSLSSSSSHPLSVLVFGMDSMSRLNFMRQLPSTYDYLIRDMKAVVLHGLTRVGSNTYPNVMGLMTGELSDDGPLERPPMGTYFDSWPLVWKKYSKAGYITLLAEDQPEFTVFNFASSGFVHQPTDCYLRPFFVAMESYSTYRLSSHLCFGSEPKHVLHTKYVRDFAVKYDRQPYFAFSFMTELSHNLLNQAGAGDGDFLEFLQTIHQGGHLEDTVFLFFSDHGNRFDPIRLTPIGRIEGSMPFCAVYLPPKVLKAHPEVVEILRNNSRRLISMLDLHETFVDILSYSTSGTRLGDPLASRPNAKGLSIFREIPKNRTCPNAGVREQFCMCSTEEPLTLSDERVQPSALAVIDSINRITDPYRNLCSQLKLIRVHNAMLVKPNEVIYEDSDEKKVQIRVVIETSPGNGMFEALARFERDRSEPQVLQDISRVNRYKGQDSCVTAVMVKKIDMRKFCYCS